MKSRPTLFRQVSCFTRQYTTLLKYVGDFTVTIKTSTNQQTQDATALAIKP